jgi:glycerol-3-phosphate dehydrogenase
VRPLAAELGVSEDDVSRDQLIFESSSGLVSIIGGKLTTHRSMAEALVDYVTDRLANEFETHAARACETQRLPVDYDSTELERAISCFIDESGFEVDVAKHIVEAYGPDATLILDIAREDQSLSSIIAAGEPYLMAEVPYAVRHEMAMKLVDFIFRRTQLANRLKDHGRSVAPIIGKIMAKELSWSSQTLERELTDFEKASAFVEVP